MSTLALRIRNWRSASLPVNQPVTWLLAAFVALATTVPAQVAPSLAFIAGNFWSLAPALAGSVALAAYFKAARGDALLQRALSGRPLTMVAGAALVGAASPFCSCGVVPIIAGLLGAGAPLAPVMAFWISSPLMSPDMFLLTAATLGLPFAVGKTVAAVGIGLLGGMVTLWLARSPAWSATAPSAAACACGGGGAPAKSQPDQPMWAVWRDRGAMSVFGEQFGALGWKLAQWIAVAFLLESLMQAWVPGEQLMAWIGSQNAWSIPLSVALGIPAYLNGYAALPLTAGLLQAGMAPGAAMGFLVAGGVTSIPAIVAVHGLVRRRVFFLYLGLSIAGAFLAAYGYQAFALL